MVHPITYLFSEKSDKSKRVGIIKKIFVFSESINRLEFQVKKYDLPPDLLVLKKTEIS